MKSYEERLLFENLLQSHNVKYKEDKVNDAFNVGDISFILPRTIIIDSKISFCLNYKEFLRKTGKMLNFKKVDQVISNIEKYDELLRKYEVLEFSVTLLNPNRQYSLFYESPYSNKQGFYGCILKFAKSKDVVEVILEDARYCVKFNKKSSWYNSNFFDNERLASNGIYDDDSLKNISLESLPRFYLYKNGKNIMEILNLSTLLDIKFLEDNI